jgi:GWxTD domain-containing protein
MLYRRSVRALSAVLFLCLLPLHAQKAVPLAPHHKQWLDKDVLFLISDDEKREFLALPGDTEREAYIQDFWQIRNPLGRSEKNPFKDEHYRRLEYATENFGKATATPGWMTDMGRAYILFGAPVSKASFKGYSQVYPLELWFYANKTGTPALPPFFQLLFFIPEDIGEYKLYRPGLDGPMRLVRGSQIRSNRDVYNFLKPIGGDLARAAFTSSMSEPIDTVDFRVDAGADVIANRIQNWANDSHNLNRIRQIRALRSSVKSYVITPGARPVELTAIALADPTGEFWLDYAVLIDDVSLGDFNAATGEMQVATRMRLLTEAGDLVFEDAEDRKYAAGDAEKKFRPFFVANRLPLVAGRYKLEIQVTQQSTGQTYRGERTLATVPAGKPELGAPLLAVDVRQAAAPNPTAPLQFFGVQFHPAVQGRFLKTDSMRLLYQVQVPEAAAYDVEYVVASPQDRSSRSTFSDTIPAESFANGRYLKSRTIALAEMPLGDYRLIMNLRKAGTTQVLASHNVGFRIEAERSSPELYFAGSSQKLNSPGLASYLRALAAMAQKDDASAERYLRSAVKQAGVNPTYAAPLVNLYFRRKSWGDVASLYGQSAKPDAWLASPQLASQVAISLWNAGQKQQAEQLLAAARPRFAKEAVFQNAVRLIESNR